MDDTKMKKQQNTLQDKVSMTMINWTSSGEDERQ